VIYQVGVYSPRGYADTISKSMKNILPCTTIWSDLSQQEVKLEGDVQLLFFDLEEGKIEVIPFCIMDVLEQMSGKTLLLFITCTQPFSEGLKQQIERSLLPFIPDACDYRGMFLCAAEYSEETFAKLERAHALHPEHEGIGLWLEQCRQCQGHPNEEDLSAAWDFAIEQLHL